VLATDPHESAAAAGLRYVKDGGPAIRRIRTGKGFRYLKPDGKPLRDSDEIGRIQALAIPPAWTNVWICPSRYGHLQAVGWDAKGRKQYRYHPLYRSVRDEAKFGRMIAFGSMLAVIRKRVHQDLGRPGLPREKVLAAVVRLLETTFIRVGNDEYARENDSFGLTTLRGEHVKISGATLTFRFRGKSGLDHDIALTDRRLANIVRQCQDLPGSSCSGILTAKTAFVASIRAM
jgi:DNA topoisomerase-1